MSFMKSVLRENYEQKLPRGGYFVTKIKLLHLRVVSFVFY